MKLRSIIPLALALALIAGPSFAQDTHGTSPWPVPEGGTGLASGVSGGVLCFNTTTSLLSSTALALNGVMVGGGAGGCPGSGASQVGTNGQVFLGVTGGPPQWGLVSGDAAISNTGAVTLAPVNSNTGPFGSATSCVTVTNNAKGLTTAVTAATCTPAIGSITGLGAGIATALANGANTAGGVVVPTAALAANGVVYGGGSGVSPAATAAGTNGQVFLGVTGGPPQWGLVSGDAAISNTGAVTLAPVNSNTGPFGSATSCVTVTNNAKGLTTAVTAATCTPAIGSITGLGTGVLAALGNTLNAASGLVGFSGALGTVTSGTLTNATGLPIATGVSGLGTGVAAALGVNVGSAGAFTTFNGAHGTPSSMTLTNATGLPVGTGVSGLGTGVATALGIAVGTTGGVMTDTSANTVTNKTIAATANTISLPYFSASMSTATQTMTTATPAKLLINSEMADSNGWYDNATNYRFTPLLAGKYRIVGHFSLNGLSGLTEIDVHIYKNGAVYATSFNVTSSTALSIGINEIVSFNGTTDYVELWGTAYGTGTLNALGGTGPIRTWFEAQYVGP